MNWIVLLSISCCVFTSIICETINVNCAKDDNSSYCVMESINSIDGESNFETNTKNFRDSKKEIRFFYSNLNKLPGLIFKAYGNLEELSCEKCLLNVIDEKTFEKANNLKKLYLHNNMISNLRNSTFNGLKNLEFLDLSRNQIEHLPNRVFSKLTKLKELDLGWNTIKHLDESLFFKLQQLTDLSLTNNQLTDVEVAIKNLKKLWNLDLRENKVTKMNSYPESVKILSISHNKLTKLFINKNVEKLFAQNNEISDVSATSDNKIERLYLQKNNLWTDEDITKLEQFGPLNYGLNPLNEISNRFLKNNSFFVYLSVISTKLMPNCRILVIENVSRHSNFSNKRNWTPEYLKCVEEFLGIIK